ncbi:MAG: 4-hydroxythreonine-4-phosphate dehydrogenase PdxA [Muribaculaceae bacterium]|nr:4-hydroxythreonine-4-phosphate dehydrogenase PdxA [Muribaculaceae bacterium]
MSRPVRVGITHGDYNGIGYEVILKALADPEMAGMCTPVIFGNSKIAETVRRELRLEDVKWRRIDSADQAQDGEISIVDVCQAPESLTPGHPSTEAGLAAAAALEAACRALEQGEIDVLVTAPINKRTIYNHETFPYPGHTEYLEARIGNGAKATMILFDDLLRVALVSTHKALRDVPAAITRENVVAKINALNDTLRRDFGMDRPRIAVLSLNPHNGDNGLLGSEEIQIITPAIQECVDKGVLAFGPYAADGFFGNGTFRKFDGIVAMYHDQGLAPFKALAGEYGVNYTAGLPFVRTSPDHGTGYDIAGKGIADPISMRRAIFKAIDLHRNRTLHDRISANPLRTTRQQPERQ